VSEEELPRGSETELLLEVGKRRAVRVRFAGSAGR